MRRFILICHVIILAIMPFRTAHAELRLETWQSYGAMAEQGGVCAAFARLMELQAMFDVKRGELWLERRKFAGTLIRQASILEGLPPAGQDDIDALINNYASWLISNLNSQGSKQSLDNAAHTAATKMVNDVCSSLYERADNAIMQTHPELATCPVVKTPDPLTCASAMLTEPTKVNAANTTPVTPVTHELKRARDEVAMLTSQNKSLRAKLRKLRASTLEFENIAPYSDNDAPIGNNPAEVSTDYTNVVAPQPEVKKNYPTSHSVETDDDALTSLAGRSKHTTPDVGIMSPDDQEQDNEVTTTDKTISPRVNAEVIRNRNVSNLFVAQLGSYASSQQANDGIHYLKTTFKDTFKVLELSVVSKTSRSGQRIYDLVTEESERAEIENICNSLWEQRFGCFVTSAN